MKKILIFLSVFICSYTQAQTYLKGNVLTTLLTIPNVGVETSIGEKSTFQFDVTASLWKSIKSNPRQFYIFVPEYRYHFKEKNNGFYIGGHIGATLFNFQKWNYLNTKKYEKGVGYIIGSTIGYNSKINEKIHLDCFFGGGSHQGFYKGYTIGTNERYEGAIKYNKSGEWLIYRVGFMVAYQLN